MYRISLALLVVCLAVGVPLLRRYVQPGDMVICLGAGTSTEWAHALPGWLGEADEPRRANA